MAKVYKSICNEIDKVYLDLLHLTRKSINYKLQVEKVMDSGFVNIAKARYIMGSKAVSAMQLPTENSNPMRALSTICRAEYKNHWVFKIHKKDYSPQLKQACTSQDEIPVAATKSEMARNLLATGMNELRKRKDVAVVDDDGFSDLKDDLLDNASTEESYVESFDSLIDPIRLFGVLVPQTLRAAQQSFGEVLDLLAKCATLQSEINSILKRYDHLMKIKHYIEESTRGKTLNIYEDKEYWASSVSSIASSYSEILELQPDYCPEEYGGNIFIEGYSEASIRDFELESTETDYFGSTSTSQASIRKDEKKRVAFVQSKEPVEISEESLNITLEKDLVLNDNDD